MFTKSFEFKLAINIEWKNVSFVRLYHDAASKEYNIVLVFNDSPTVHTVYAASDEAKACQAFNWIMQQIPSADE